MPVLNGEKYVRQAISSVLSQNYGDWELVVVDNGSTDGTLEIVKQYAEVDDRISVYAYNERKSEYSATNYGIGRARGEIIGILHQDDMYTPGALSHVAGTFEADRDLDVLCPKVLVIVDHDGRIEVEGEYQTDLLFENLVRRRPLEPARFFKKQFFQSAGPIDDSYRYSGFREWWIRNSLRPGVKWLSTPHICYIYRRHAGQTSSSLDKYALLKYVREHYRMFRDLLQSGRLTEEQEKVVRERWLNDSITGFSLALRDGRLRDAFFCMTRGIRINPAWSIKLARKKLRLL